MAHAVLRISRSEWDQARLMRRQEQIALAARITGVAKVDRPKLVRKNHGGQFEFQR